MNMNEQNNNNYNQQNMNNFNNFNGQQNMNNGYGFGNNISQGQNFQTNMNTTGYYNNTPNKKSPVKIIVAVVALVIFLIAGLTIGAILLVLNISKSDETRPDIEIESVIDEDELDLDDELNNEIDNRVDNEIGTTEKDFEISKPLLDDKDYDSYKHEPEVDNNNTNTDIVDNNKDTDDSNITICRADVDLSYDFTSPEFIVDDYYTKVYLIGDLDNVVRDFNNEKLYLPVLAVNFRDEAVSFEFSALKAEDYKDNDLYVSTDSKISLKPYEKSYTFLEFDIENTDVKDYDGNYTVDVDFNVNFILNNKTYNLGEGNLNNVGGTFQYISGAYETIKELSDYNYEKDIDMDYIYLYDYTADNPDKVNESLLDALGFTDNKTSESAKTNNNKEASEKYMNTFLDFDNCGITEDTYTLELDIDEDGYQMRTYSSKDGNGALIIMTSDVLDNFWMSEQISKSLISFGETEKEDLTTTNFSSDYPSNIKVYEERLSTIQGSKNKGYVFTVSFKDEENCTAILYVDKSESRRDNMRNSIINNLR